MLYLFDEFIMALIMSKPSQWFNRPLGGI